MRSVGTDPELVNHFTVAIYPFVHGLTGNGLGGRLETCGERWRPWWARLGDDELAGALESTSFFLPYVRTLLYPETALLRDEPPGERCGRWVRRVRALTALGLGSWFRDLPSRSVLRLTCRGRALDTLADFTVTSSREGPDGGLPACLEWVDAVLFPSGLGFLLLKARVVSERPRLSELIRLNQALRLVYPPTLDWEMPVLRPVSTDEPLHLRDLIDFFLEGLTDGSAVPAEEAPLRMHQVGGRPSYTDTEAGRAHGDHCQLLSYACVDLPEAARAELAAGAFASGVDRLLFEYAACIGLGETVHNPMWVPSRRQGRRLCREHRLSLWRCWQAMALKECLAFLATEDLRFTRKSLPRTVEADYLPLYLYTLYQKLQLSAFANGLMREVAQVEGHLRGARGLLRRFVAFRNRYWFSEVTRKPQGGDLYRALQQSLEVPALYQLVTSSVKEAKEYYQDRWDRQVKLLWTVVGAASPVAVAQYLWFHLDHVWAVGLVLFGLLVGGAIVLLLLKRQPRRRHRRASRGRGHMRAPRWLLGAFRRERQSPTRVS